MLTKLTPAGRDPVFVRTASGLPTVVTLKLPGVPAWNAALTGLVNLGACVTINVNVCVAIGATPFATVSVNV